MLSKLKSKHPHLFTLSIMEFLGYGTSLAALGYLTVFLQDIGMDAVSYTHLEAKVPLHRSFLLHQRPSAPHQKESDSHAD